MGSSTENSAYHPVHNPRDKSRVPGGSSGGSAAAVAAGMAVATLGSDTGGSIRQPASFCGVVGLKPTYGRVSRYGLIAFASSLDHIGPFAKTVKEAALVLRTIAGRDPMDSTSADVPVPDYVAELEKPIQGLKIGVAKEYFGDGLDPEVRAAVEAAIQKLARPGMRGRSRLAAAHRICDPDVLHRSHRRSVVEPGSLRWCPLRIPRHATLAASPICIGKPATADSA